MTHIWTPVSGQISSPQQLFDPSFYSDLYSERPSMTPPLNQLKEFPLFISLYPLTLRYFPSSIYVHLSKCLWPVSPIDHH